jgi:hypothetical protein
LRSKTASNRLRHVDNFPILCDPQLIRRTDAGFPHHDVRGEWADEFFEARRRR